jgi:hypothetical protein
MSLKEKMESQPKLNPEIKAQWLAALRDERIEQGCYSLRQFDGNGGVKYCCLGVATELYRISEANTEKLDWERVEQSRFHSFNGYHSLLAKPVQAWLGSVNSSCGLVIVPQEIREKYELFEATIFSVAELNDRGVSFHDIANLIEEQL